MYMRAEHNCGLDWGAGGVLGQVHRDSKARTCIIGARKMQRLFRIRNTKDNYAFQELGLAASV